jgi:hypothetical protein
VPASACSWIQRYKRQNVPADASAYAYVLDMVVESERVGR